MLIKVKAECEEKLLPQAQLTKSPRSGTYPRIVMPCACPMHPVLAARAKGYGSSLANAKCIWKGTVVLGRYQNQGPALIAKTACHSLKEAQRRITPCFLGPLGLRFPLAHLRFPSTVRSLGQFVKGIHVVYADVRNLAAPRLTMSEIIYREPFGVSESS